MSVVKLKSGGGNCVSIPLDRLAFIFGNATDRPAHYDNIMAGMPYRSEPLRLEGLPWAELASTMQFRMLGQGPSKFFCYRPGAVDVCQYRAGSRTFTVEIGRWQLRMALQSDYSEKELEAIANSCISPVGQIVLPECFDIEDSRLIYV